MYYDKKGTKLWGQRAYVQYKKDRGELGATKGGGVRKKQGAAGGAKKRRPARK